MDVPYLGAAFRRTSNKTNEVELLIMVRPELVEGLDPDQVPPCGPGMNSTNPSDTDLFWKGHIEVPVKPPHGPAAGGAGIMAPESINPPAAAPVEEMPAASGRRGASNTVVVSDVPGGRLPPAGPSIARAAPNSPNYPSNPQRRKARPQTNPDSSPPGFIGPRGYDVRN